MDIGDVGDPDLIGCGWHQAADQIGDDENARWSFCRRLQERHPALCEQIVLAHKPLNFLCIHHHTLAPEGSGHPPIAVEDLLEADALDHVAQLALGGLAAASGEMTVIRRARQTREAHSRCTSTFGSVACEVIAWMTSIMRVRVCLALPAAPMRARLVEKKSRSICWRKEKLPPLWTAAALQTHRYPLKWRTMRDMAEGTGREGRAACCADGVVHRSPRQEARRPGRAHPLGARRMMVRISGKLEKETRGLRKIGVMLGKAVAYPARGKVSDELMPISKPAAPQTRESTALEARLGIPRQAERHARKPQRCAIAGTSAAEFALSTRFDGTTNAFRTTSSNANMRQYLRLITKEKA